MVKKKEKKIHLPKQLLAIENMDKGFHEKWSKGRDLLNFTHPFRGVFLGPPHTGKSTTIKNIILRADPPFERAICVHCDAEHTREWDDIGADMVSAIPPPSDFGGNEEKTAVIIDDVSLKQMSKEQKSNLDRLFGYVSTHCNVSVFLTSQDSFNIMPCVRRCANLWVIWRIRDLDSAMCLARKAGIKRDQFNYIFDNFIHEMHDSLWLDHTHKSPAPLRINGYDILEKG
jgi:hypothetical protein